MKKILAAVTALLLLAGSLVAWSPSVRSQVVLTPDFAPGWEIKITIPDRLRIEERGAIQVQIAVGHEGPAQALVARLDLPGMRGAGDEKGLVAGPPAQVNFEWMVSAIQAGLYSGTIWIYTGGQRSVVLARPISVEVSQLPILFIWILRVVLVIGLVANGWYLKSVIKSKHPYRVR